MKKTFVVFVVCSVLGANLCLGTELVDSKNFESQVSLSQVDKEMLFGVDANQADVVLLSDEEMKATEGEGALLTALGIAYKTYTAYETGKKVIKLFKKWF